ncbi:TetR/AcrR family transcriptional regulator [Bordetella petrii]|uniref:TetR/AcrR family transcriptional regulator n=1 Tax=Bordetella petrii TaxID=94624 RepID=UPI001A96E23B|nr:TetR/AcrR family transcriptional regulator [Bordetella petrii]MBO1114834.1 TetR/AcrR family transcriptional regulator [Bordetella petrii]
MATQPSRKQLTHDRILQTAARAIRRGGYGGAGVADIMQEAGLTHGGFYAHFPSRDAMLAAAVERAGQESAERLARHQDAQARLGIHPLRALVESYLSDAHLAAPERGCPVAALLSEMPRQAAPVRDASRERVRALMQRVRQAMPEATPEQAHAVAGTLVGALQMARALGGAEGKAVLSSCRQVLLNQYAHSSPHRGA